MFEVVYTIRSTLHQRAMSFCFAFLAHTIMNDSFHLPILCTYFEGSAFSSQQGKLVVELKHHLRFMYKKNTSISVTRPKSAPSIVVLSIFTENKIRKKENSESNDEIFEFLKFNFIIYDVYVATRSLNWLFSSRKQTKVESHNAYTAALNVDITL